MNMDRLELLTVLGGCTKELTEFFPAAYYSELIPDETIREKMQSIGQQLIEGSKTGIRSV